jgi:hypothetical protein
MTPDEMKAAAEEYANPNALKKGAVSIVVWNSITRSIEDFLAGAKWMQEHLAKGGDGHPPRIQVYKHPDMNGGVDFLLPSGFGAWADALPLCHKEPYISKSEHTQKVAALESRIAELEGALEKIAHNLPHDEACWAIAKDALVEEKGKA